LEASFSFFRQVLLFFFRRALLLLQLFRAMVSLSTAEEVEGLHTTVENLLAQNEKGRKPMSAAFTEVWYANSGEWRP